MTLSHFCGEGRGNAESTIACSPDMPRCGIVRGFCPCRINKKATGVAFLWRKARDSNPRILSHQRFSRPPLSTAQPAFRACKLYHKKRLICKPYRKIKEENQKYGAVLYFVHGKRQEETDKYKLSIYCRTIWNKKKN